MSFVTAQQVHLQYVEFAQYPVDCPYHPCELYPEYPFGGENISRAENVIYTMVRQCLLGLELDKERFGTCDWNPLGEIVSPGDTVLVKPNMVLHIHKRLGIDGLPSLVTHSSITRAIIDYVIIALKGGGRITLGDAPIQYCDFDTISRELGYDDILSFYHQRGIDISLVDFRLYKSDFNKSALVTIQPDVTNCLFDDCIAVDIGRSSRLQSVSCQYKKFRVTNYDPVAMLAHHSRSKHEYLIHKSVLDADVVINLPTLKTHRKVGLTCSLKNLVGINGIKDCLPHHTRGSKSEGGDEYLHTSMLKKWFMDIQESIDCANIQGRSRKARVLRKLRKPLSFIMNLLQKDSYMEGSWYGNDTIWRTCLDLNTIIFYADKKGVLQETVQRRYLTLVDAIVAGDGEGPLRPTPKPCGVIGVGLNPVVVDAVMAQLVGFDFNKIPLVQNGFALDHHILSEISPENITISSNDPLLQSCGIKGLFQPTEMAFTPSVGWAAVLSGKN